jgi:hypothetical protein
MIFRRNARLTFVKRSIIVSFVMLLCLVAVACGELRINVYTVDASGCSGYSESFGAKINDEIQESTTLDGSCLSNTFEGSGNKAKTFSVTNRNGDRAKVGFEIINSKSYSGSYMLSPKTADYAQATEKLDVSNADLIYAFAKAVNRDGIAAGTSIHVIKGSSKWCSLKEYSNNAYADEYNANAWQNINSASGENIELYAATSDKFVRNFADSSVSVVGHGVLKNYGSEADALILPDENIDLYAMHGSFDMDDTSGIISGDKINSKGLTFNQNRLIALYGVTIDRGSIEGSFDWGTETISNQWALAVPLETPAEWSETNNWDKIKIYASKISSYSVALDGKKVESNHWAIDKDVSTTDWVYGSGFAEPSQSQ